MLGKGKGQKPNVVSVRSSDFGVIVEFDDGRVADFQGYSHGFGYGCEGLRTFKLSEGGRLLFHLNSRLYRAGPQSDENKVFFRGGITQQKAAAYWDSAREYLQREYFDKPETSKNKTLWWPWRLINCEGGFELERLRGGTMEELAEKMTVNSQDDDGFLAVFGALVSSMGGGGDKGNMFPGSDAEDLSRGAQFIPGEVTLARREGKKVQFITGCSSRCCWYWQLPDGTRIYHFERSTYERILKEHGGICPSCSNAHIIGGTVRQ